MTIFENVPSAVPKLNKINIYQEKISIEIFNLIAEICK